MLSTLCALALSLTAPQTEAVWAAEHSRGPGRTMVVEGELELTRSDAEASALERARDAHRTQLRERADRIASSAIPFWMPQMFAQPTIDRWIGDLERSAPLQVLDSDTEELSYSYGKAFRSSVTVARVHRDGLSKQEARLERRLGEVGKLLLAKCGVTAIVWGLLAFVCSWFDRLTRGYMTGRLRLIALAMGIAVPGILMLA